MSLYESFIVFICFGQVISQNLFKISHLKKLIISNAVRTGRACLTSTKYLEFSLNRSTTISAHLYICSYDMGM